MEEMGTSGGMVVVEDVDEVSLAAPRGVFLV